MSIYMFTKNKKSKLKSLLLVILLKLKPTSRIKTVRAGARDCPQDNPLSKRAQNFDSRTN